MSCSYHKLAQPFFRLVGPAVLLIVFVWPASVTAAPSQVRISGFPSVHQSYSLSCEYAAASAVTRYWGNRVTERDFISAVPQDPNPHKGFRGNINGSWGGINDYGVYAEPLVPVLEGRGYEATVYYGDLARLTATLRSQNPVVVWLTSGRDVERPVYTRTVAGATFKLVPGEHAVVAYGYDAGSIYLMDVGDGGFYKTPWDSFLRRWGYFDEMMLVITPAGD